MLHLYWRNQRNKPVILLFSLFLFSKSQLSSLFSVFKMQSMKGDEVEEWGGQIGSRVKIKCCNLFADDSFLFSSFAACLSGITLEHCVISVLCVWDRLKEQQPNQATTEKK